jgi:hypothetical protein
MCVIRTEIAGIRDSQRPAMTREGDGGVLAVLGGVLGELPQTRSELRARTIAVMADVRALIVELESSVDQAQGRRDLFKQIVGQSSLEKALEEARRMLACHERVLDELDRADRGVEAGVVRTVCR